MVKLKSTPMELRGIANKNSKNGNVYYVVYVENSEGKPYNFIVRDASIFPQGLSKGDNVLLTFEYFTYNNEPRLNLIEIEVA